MGCGSSGSNPAAGIEQQQAQQQYNTQQAINSINQAFSRFNPSFYQGVQNAYTNFALPQLQNQYQTANSQLGYKLGDQGLLNSSAANQARNSLSQNMSQAQNQIGNQAVQQGQNLQQTIGQEQATLYGQAQTATNPAAFQAAALAQAGSLNAPSTFAPLGQMLNNFSQQYLTNQSSNMYNQLANQYLNGYSNPAVFGSNVYAGGGGALPQNLYP